VVEEAAVPGVGECHAGEACRAEEEACRAGAAAISLEVRRSAARDRLNGPRWPVELAHVLPPVPAGRGWVQVAPESAQEATVPRPFHQDRVRAIVLNLVDSPASAIGQVWVVNPGSGIGRGSQIALASATVLVSITAQA
jgi:hypothetical protein